MSPAQLCLRARARGNRWDKTQLAEHLAEQRAEEELDPVTLHNQALMKIEADPSGGFRKLNFLLQNPPFPPSTFGNLLLLYCKYQYYDLAADVLAENTHLTFKMLTPDLYEYLDASIVVQTSPEEAYRKYDDLPKKNIEVLR